MFGFAQIIIHASLCWQLSNPLTHEIYVHEHVHEHIIVKTERNNLADAFT